MVKLQWEMQLISGTPVILSLVVQVLVTSFCLETIHRQSLILTSLTLIEKLTTGDGTNNLTLGTKADDSTLKTVTGGGGVDTIDAAFTAVLTISSVGELTLLPLKLVLWLSQLMPVPTTINVVGANLTDADTIAGGANTDSIVLTAIRQRLSMLISTIFLLSRNSQLLMAQIA